MLTRKLVYRKIQSTEILKDLRYPHGNFGMGPDDRTEITFCHSEKELIEELRKVEGEADMVVLDIPGDIASKDRITRILDRLLIPHLISTSTMGKDNTDNHNGIPGKGNANNGRISKISNPPSHGKENNLSNINKQVRVEIIRQSRYDREGQPVGQSLIREEKLNALRELATGLAHELNNLITPIVGYAQLLKGKVSDKNIVRKLEIIEKSAFQASEVVSDLFLFSGNNHIEPERISTTELFNRIVESAKGSVSERNEYKLITEGIPTEGVLFCDMENLLEAFTRIIDNAKNSMPFGGEIGIRVKIEKVTERTINFYDFSRDRRKNSLFRESFIEKGKKIFIVEISDQGTGMDPETIKKAVFPFYSNKQGMENRGLGLALAYGIVQNHDGVLHIRSKPGSGSVISVILPLTR